MRTRITIIAAALAALVPGLLGAPVSQAQPTSGPATAAVQAVLLQFAQARYADDGRAMCQLLTPRAMRSLGVTGGRAACPARLTALFATPAGQTPPTLAAVQAHYANAQIEVIGRRAYATVQEPGTVDQVLAGQPSPYAGTLTYSEALVLRHGAWRIDALSATGA